MTFKNKAEPLSALRLIAFLCVFLLHAKLFMPMPWNEGIRFPWLTYTPAWSGVWIFLILSGYGIGIGFTSGRYQCDLNGIIGYYIKRLGKIIPLYWFYVLLLALFITPEILLPTRPHLKQLLSLFFFHYQEEFLATEFGLSWYLTTLVRLYFVAPFFYLIYKKLITSRKKLLLAWFVTVALGFLVRMIMFYHIKITGENWTVVVYKPFYFNLDFFFSGFLLSGLASKPQTSKSPGLLKAAIALAFVVLLIVNSFLFYYALVGRISFFLEIVEHLLPTAYIVAVCAVIYLWDIQKSYLSSPLSFHQVLRNPLRIIDYFPRIQMPCYLFHATILLTLQQSYSDSFYARCVSLLCRNPQYENFLKSCVFTAFALVLTIIWSTVIHCLFAHRPAGSIQKKLESIDYFMFLTIVKNKIIILGQRLFPE